MKPTQGSHIFEVNRYRVGAAAHNAKREMYLRTAVTTLDRLRVALIEMGEKAESQNVFMEEVMRLNVILFEYDRVIAEAAELSDVKTTGFDDVYVSPIRGGFVTKK